MVNNDTNFKSIELLRCWCMKSLPTVFSDALSYNQQVCLLTKAINDMATTINGLPDYIIELVKELLDQLGLEEIVKEVLADLYFLNVKNPPNNMVAAVGDGVTDDTAAIQAVISYLGGKRAYLFFPAGIYSVTGLNVTTNMSLVGLDRYQTTLQLRAGSNKDLLTGDLGACTISDITLDANMPGQTQNCSVFDGNVGNMLVNNVIFKNGYDVLGIEADGLVQMDNIVFDGVQGNGLSIGGDRAVINDIQFVNNSTLNAGTLITVSGNNSMITGLLNTGGGETGLNVAGNNNVIVGVIRGATTSIVNTGTDNYIDIIGSVHTVIDGAYTHTMNGDYTTSMNSKRETMSRHKTVTIGGNNLETITGTNTISSGVKTETITGNSTETVSGNKTINANGISVTANEVIEVDGHSNVVISAHDLILNPTNPLTYKEPLPLMNNFSYVPAKSTAGADYKILTTTEDSLEIGDIFSVDCPEGGIESSIIFYENSMAYVLKFKPTNVKILPTNGNITGDPHENQLPIGTYALTRSEIIISNGGFEGASVFNGTYNARRDANVAFYAGFTTTDINLLKAINGEKNQSNIIALGDNVEPVASPLVQNHIKYDYTEILNSSNVAIKNQFNKILGTNPRKIIAVDDNGYFYVISVSGRNLMNKGWTYDDCINFCMSQNYKTAVQMDGGGSVQTVVDKVSVIDNFSQTAPRGRNTLTAILWEVNQ